MQEKLMLSPNYSTSRGPYNKIAFHTTEGAMTIEALGDWFGQEAAGCSSHHGADQYKRVLGAYVYENHKAWTQGNANPYCISLEMCAYASWSRSTWLSKPILLDNAAEWCRYLVDKYSIPWTLLNDSQAQNPDVRGICQHVNFGSWGSGHHDCGSGFPMDVVIDKAKKWGSGGAATPAGQGGEEMASSAFDYQGRRWLAMVWKDGKVNVKPPGGSFYAVDKDQSGAYPGASITASPDGRAMFIDYVNGAKSFCTYQSEVDNQDWGWSKQSPDDSVKV